MSLSEALQTTALIHSFIPDIYIAL